MAGSLFAAAVFSPVAAATAAGPGVRVEPLRLRVVEIERRSEIRRAAVEVVERGDAVALELATDTLFAFDSAVLARRARRALDTTADQVERRRTTRLVIEGHTDSRGTAAYNERLSEQRAEAVAAALRQRLATSPAIAVRGRGEAAPVASNNQPVGRRANRRVSVTLAGR